MNRNRLGLVAGVALWWGLGCGEAFESTGSTSGDTGMGQGAAASSSAGQGAAGTTSGGAGGTTASGGGGGADLCGNGQFDPGEACDPSAPVGSVFAADASCGQSGGGPNGGGAPSIPMWAGGTTMLRCTKDCQLDKAGCFVGAEITTGSTCQQPIEADLELQGPLSVRSFSGLLPTTQDSTALPAAGCATQSTFPGQTQHRVFKVVPKFNGYLSAALRPFGQTTMNARLHAFGPNLNACEGQASVCADHTGTGEVVALAVTKDQPIHLVVDGTMTNSALQYHLVVRASQGTCTSPVWMPNYGVISNKNFLLANTSGAMSTNHKACSSAQDHPDVVVEVPELPAGDGLADVTVAEEGNTHNLIVVSKDCKPDTSVTSVCDLASSNFVKGFNLPALVIIQAREMSGGLVTVAIGK